MNQRKAAPGDRTYVRTYVNRSPLNSRTGCLPFETLGFWRICPSFRRRLSAAPGAGSSSRSNGSQQSEAGATKDKVHGSQDRTGGQWGVWRTMLLGAVQLLQSAVSKSSRTDGPHGVGDHKHVHVHGTPGVSGKYFSHSADWLRGAWRGGGVSPCEALSSTAGLYRAGSARGRRQWQSTPLLVQSRYV